MKKTYLEPTLEVVKIATTQMLAASVEGFNATLDDNGVDAGNALAPGLELPGLNLPGMNLPQ
jgi:hypothetical protein